MAGNNFSVAVYAKEIFFEKEIKRAPLPGKYHYLLYTEVKKITDYCLKVRSNSVVVWEYEKGLPVNKLADIAARNKKLNIIIILAGYNPRLINNIIKSSRLDFAVKGKTLIPMLSQKLASRLSYYKTAAKEEKRKNDFKSDYFNLLDNMIIGLYRTTPEGKVIMLNRAALKIVGCKSIADVRKVNLEDEYYDPYKLRSIFKKQLMEKGEVKDFENWWRRPDGKILIVRENAKAVKDKKGNVLYYEGTFEDITSRIQIEKALDESEKKLHLALEVAKIGIWNWNIKTNEIYFSREFFKMLDYLPGQLVPSVDVFINLFHIDDRYKILKDMLANVTPANPDFEIEARMINKSGKTLWIYLKGRVIEWSGIVPIYIIAAQEDITERKQIVSQIIESEIKFRELAENIEEVFWLLGDKEILYISPGLEKLWGIPAILGAHLAAEIYRTVHSDDRQRIRNAIKIEVTKGPGIFNEEFRIIRPDGTERWIWARTFPVRKGDIIYRSVGIAEDITGRKRIQLELKGLNDRLEETVEKRTAELKELNIQLVNEIKKQKDAEEVVENQLKFFRILIETTASPIFIKDANKKYIDCNKAFEEYFGVSRENILGKADSDFMSPEFANRFEYIDDQLISNPGEITYEGITRHEPPFRKEYRITKSTFLKADGTPGGIIAFVKDITEKKKLDLNIKKAFDKEKELLEVKSKLISTASHEFRTPLTTILSSMDLMEIYKAKDNTEKYLEHTLKIKSAVKYMIELLNDVMTISKAESGKLEYSPNETDLIELCTEIINETRQVLGNSVEITFNHKEDIKPVFADKKLLKLIISNLLNNAVKYSPQGETVSLDIEISDKILFIIADNGIGIPSEEFPMLFEPFHRGKNSAQKPGTGLGLSIVKRCIDLHEGNISFESEINKGTTFYVSIPFMNS